MDETFEYKRPSCNTHPVVEGGSYQHKQTKQTATIMGTQIDPVTGWRQGRLYDFTHGHIGRLVTENTQNFTEWELIGVKSAANATKLIKEHTKRCEALLPDDAEVLAKWRAAA